MARRCGIGCWKYLYEIDSDRSKLFDVGRDPDELQELSHDFCTANS